jgi:poly(A) polymerase
MGEPAVKPADREAAARAICRVLSQAGFRALLAGGCVRDMILGREPDDYDIATDARPADAARLFEKTLDVGAAWGVTMVLTEKGRFEVTAFRSDGPYLDGRHPATIRFTDEKEDALRRDFTINAMFLDPETDVLIDYTGGRADLDAGILRSVGNPDDRFSEDYLRLLRGIRFAARFGYTIEENTFRAMQRHAGRILHTSAERIRDELVKMLTEGKARGAFELLDETGLLTEILPEVAAMKGVEQPPAFHPEGDVFQHTLLMLEHLAAGASSTLAMAALLHDAGKPLTKTISDRIRFNYHHKAGARIAEDICRRLRFSKAETARIAWIVEQHMRVADIPQMKESRRRRFVREPGFDELLAVCRIDCLASHGSLDTIAWIMDYLARLEPEKMRPEPLLTGKDLIEMGYSPGPVFSKILDAVETAQLEEELTDSAEARNFVRRNWPPHS